MVRKLTSGRPAKKFKAAPINLGVVADRDIDLEERKQEFKEAVLSPFVKFFVLANLVALVVIGILALVEICLVIFEFKFQRIVTEKVLIAVFIAIAAQTAAIIIAAFRGLFGK